MSKIYRAISILILIVLVSSLVLVGCGDNSGSSALTGPIKIGWTGQLSGPASAYGIPGQNEFKMAIDQINAKGGVLGQKLEVIYLDDRGDATQQMTNVRQLVEKEGVVFIVGGNSAPAAVLPYLAEQKVPNVFTSAPAEFTDPAKYPYAFGVLYTTPQVVQVASEYMVKKLGIKKLGSIAPSSAACKDQEAAAADFVKNAGGTLVGSEFVNVGDLDMTAQLQKLKAAGAEGLLLWTNVPETPKTLLNMKSMGWDIPVSGAAGLAAASGVALAGPDAYKKVYAAWWKSMQYSGSPDNLPQRSKDFIANLKKTYGDKADFSWAGKMNDQAFVIRTGIERAKSTNPDKIKAALESAPLTDTVAGKLVYTAKDHSGSPPEELALGMAATNKDGTMQLAPNQ
ncbi:MAG: ABC transporter substrate-binding protein [Dehalococcoidia bacterium]|nr:ABC transporter substrate-binding protein [Dehalococcoidia bacterium]